MALIGQPTSPVSSYSGACVRMWLKRLSMWSTVLTWGLPVGVGLRGVCVSMNANSMYISGSRSINCPNSSTAGRSGTSPPASVFVIEVINPPLESLLVRWKPLAHPEWSGARHHISPWPAAGSRRVSAGAGANRVSVSSIYMSGVQEPGIDGTYIARAAVIFAAADLSWWTAGDPQFAVQEAQHAHDHHGRRHGNLLQGLGIGQPIVFSHGWPLSADDWDTQMMFFLLHGYRVIAHDRRGHGRSAQVSDGHDMDHYADDLAAVTAHLDLHNAVHVGHSTGGGEVVRYIARHGGAGWRRRC